MRGVIIEDTGGLRGQEGDVLAVAVRSGMDILRKGGMVGRQC